MHLEISLLCKRRVPPKQMNFRKSSKRPLTPRPNFQKIILPIFFPKFMTKVPFYNGKNLQYNFLIGIMTPLSELFRKFIRFWWGVPFPKCAYASTYETDYLLTSTVSLATEFYWFQLTLYWCWLLQMSQVETKSDSATK